jgi:hypothetical protein
MGVVGGVHTVVVCAVLLPVLFGEKDEPGTIQLVGKERTTRIFGSQIAD